MAIVVGAEALDLLWVPAKLLGRVKSSALRAMHSLAASIIWSAVFGHWVLDFITHPMGAFFGEKPRKPLPPDMPLWLSASSRKVGLGLYNHSFVFSVVFDLGLTIIGIAAFLLPPLLR